MSYWEDYQLPNTVHCQQCNCRRIEHGEQLNWRQFCENTTPEIDNYKKKKNVPQSKNNSMFYSIITLKRGNKSSVSDPPSCFHRTVLG